MLDKKQQAIIEGELNERLKSVKSFRDYRVFWAEAGQYDAYLHSKRRGCRAFNFKPDSYNPDRAYYLYDDGESTGHAKWENLWRVLRVRI